MLKTHSRFFETLLLLWDLLVLGGAWLAAYGVRFSAWPVPIYYGVPPLQDYLFVLLCIPVIWGGLFKSLRLYRPRRTSSHLAEVRDILKAATLMTLGVMVVVYFLRKFEVSRLVLVYFWGLSSVGLVGTHVGFRAILRGARRRGYNLRHVVILGTGPLALTLRQQIGQHPELGLRIVGLLTPHVHEVGKALDGIPVLGRIDDVQTVVRTRNIDQVFIALSLDGMMGLEKIMQQLATEMVDIKIVPDLLQYAIVQGSIEEFEGLPIITLSGSPMYGWNSVLKRLFDLVISVPLLILGAPLLGVIAGMVKLTSPGPVFYRQERMGFDGKTFRIIKFRTMRVDAEETTGAVWTQADDPRRTRFGVLLRRTSLDELPQLWNVVKGDMSLVGPRPERPVFVEEFRQRIPRYMLRHRAKAGITGWAQIHGWRGNTSLEKRLEHDLYYIQHWSIGLDAKILWLTLWRGFVHKHAY